MSRRPAKQMLHGEHGSFTPVTAAAAPIQIQIQIRSTTTTAAADCRQTHNKQRRIMMADSEEEGVPYEEQEYEYEYEEEQEEKQYEEQQEEEHEEMQYEEQQEEEQEDQSSSIGGPEVSEPSAAAENRPEERAEEGAAARRRITVESTLEQFKMRKFFVLRPGTLNQAIKEVEALVNEKVDGSVCSVWLMAEVDHWNNEKERLVLITEHSLLVFKYDFIMFVCEQIQRIPLNYIDRISYGTFTFPKPSLLERDGEGVRIFWDRLREPSFTSRWNPFATDFPFITFTFHPVANISEGFGTLCDIHSFRVQLRLAAQRGHALKPVPGKANGVLILNQPIEIEAYLGVMSFLGNQNKLGYSIARGAIGY